MKLSSFLNTYRITIVLFLLIGLGYFLLRLPNLTQQPVFVDEAIYIRWSQIMRAEPSLRFISLTDGKTPLFMWLMIPILKLINDPLLAGRLLSVLSGFFGVVGVAFLGWKFFKRSVGLWAAFLMTITPFIVFFDRMALVDSMLSVFFLWSLILALWLVQKPRLDLSLILGYLVGGSILTKTPGYFNIIMTPVSLISFNFFGKNKILQLLKLILFWAVALVTVLLMYSILKLGDSFNSLASRNQDYVFLYSRLLQYPLDPFIPHLKSLFEWFPKFLGIPFLLFLFLGIYKIVKERNRVGLVVFLWGSLPLFVEMLLLKTFTARYILFSIPPLIVITALGLTYLDRYKSLVKVLMVAVLLIWPVYFNFNLLIAPENAPLPSEERRGYLEDWTAGYGLYDIASFLNDQSKKGLVVVGTEGSFGTLPDGLQIYLDKNKDVVIKGGSATVSADLRKTALEHPTYFVSNKSRYHTQRDLEKIAEYPKAYNPDYPQDAMLLFKLIPNITDKR